MWEKIETYIEQNRHELDQEEPRAEVWDRIEAHLHSEQAQAPIKDARIKRFYFLEAAAVIVILLGIGLWWFSHPGSFSAKRVTADMVAVQPENTFEDWKEIEAYYTMEINQVMEEILTSRLKSDTVAVSNFEELKAIEDASEILLRKLQKEDMDYEVVRELAKNYERRKEILRTILHDVATEKPTSIKQ